MIHVGCLVALKDGKGSTGEVTEVDPSPRPCVATVYWGVSDGRLFTSRHPFHDLTVVATAVEVMEYRAHQSIMLIG